MASEKKCGRCGKAGRPVVQMFKKRGGITNVCSTRCARAERKAHPRTYDERDWHTTRNPLSSLLRLG